MTFGRGKGRGERFEVRGERGVLFLGAVER